MDHARIHSLSLIHHFWWCGGVCVCLAGSPYAVSSHNDTGRIEGVYSLAGSPGIQLTGASSLLYDKTASEVQPGGNVQAIYAKVNKQT